MSISCVSMYFHVLDLLQTYDMYKTGIRVFKDSNTRIIRQEYAYGHQRNQCVYFPRVYVFSVRLSIFRQLSSCLFSVRHGNTTDILDITRIIRQEYAYCKTGIRVFEDRNTYGIRVL